MRSCWPAVPLLLLCAGCEGETTTDTEPWSCNEINPECPVTPEPAGMAGFWRFDGSALEGAWHGFVNGEGLTWVECDDHGRGEWVTDGHWPPVCGTERLGGLGGSLRLNANGYVEALTDSLAPGPLTLAAWVSMYRGEPRMTVVSAVRQGCQSAWLDLDTNDWERTLVLSVEKPTTGGDQCDVDELRAPLPSGYLDWGQGNWYHVAAVVDAENGHALFVDGRATKPSSSATAQRGVTTLNGLRIGADPRGTPDTAFYGLIDDVALFSRAVTQDELETFVSESTSVRSDGQPWTPWSVAGSTAIWKSDCRNPEIEQSQAGAQVVVKNGYWSAAGLLTRQRTGRKIGKLKKATLVADIPGKKSFDFILGSAHNAERCTWHASGTGKGRYEFDLDGLNNCDCPSTCDCTFTVEEARIASRWDEDVPLEFSVCRVEFEWEEAEADAADGTVNLEFGPGGVDGVNGWCWRPISYHEGAYVDIDEALTNANQTVGTLVAENNETAYLAADFAVGAPAAEASHLCNLQQVTAITLTADMPDDYLYDFRIADFNGVAREWSSTWHKDQSTQTFVLCHSKATIALLEANPDALPDTVDCGRYENPIRTDMTPVNLDSVRYLGIQKNYDKVSDATISILDVEFEGAPGNNCVVSTSSGGGPG